MVTKIEEEIAGSAFQCCKVSGTSTPARPAITILHSIAAPMTAPSKGFWNSTATITPITTATVPPFKAAIDISRRIARVVLASVNWLVAIARTVTASVWVPALPPIPATIGMSTAKATIAAITSSNCAITLEATEAVSRFARSQRTRAL